MKVRNLLAQVGASLGFLVFLMLITRQIIFPEPPKLPLSQTIEAQSNIIAMTFTNDGLQLISASGNTPIKLWNWTTKRNTTIFDDRSSNALSISVSRDGAYVATGHGNFQESKNLQERDIKIWDRKTGQLLKTLKGHTAPVRAVAFSPNGSRIVSGGQDKVIKVWDANTGKLLQNIPAHTDHITSISFSNNGKFFASASDDKTIKLWDSNSLKLLNILEGHRGQVLSVAFSSNDRVLVSGSGEDRFDQNIQENSVNVWDLKTGNVQHTLTGNAGWVWSVAVSHNNKYVASGGYDGTVRVWNLISGELVGIGAEHSKQVYTVKFSPDDQLLVSGSDDGRLRLWKIQPQ
ncbi:MULTISPECIES: WD40 repeat domain-containing protein [unclassified Microcoleus]|uniref:WD40 repeat domain-containing protein n=1 Tax=unclassified Microcoleus TaxID=2642155 RepID=UPI0025CCDB03|nr:MULTISPECIES: WD40 repeat domain-containing protein [unclassified Microcoleus]TAG98107.1 MAG: WD40 repeat domain-containing protein [Oscillatoriales cyanobacterium]